MSDFIDLKEKIRKNLRSQNWLFCKVLETEHEKKELTEVIKLYLWRHTKLISRLMEELNE